MVIQRPCTVTAHVPSGLGAVDRKSFLNSVLETVPKDEIKCVQELKSYFRITFSSLGRKEDFAENGMSIRGVYIPILEADEFKLVRLHNIPFEVPEEDVKKVLSKFGVVKSLRFEMDSSGVSTGTRLARMDLRSSIPNNLSVEGYPFVVWYPGIPKVCRVCQAIGHIASACPNKGLCQICRCPGHIARSCPEKNTVDHSNPWRPVTRSTERRREVVVANPDPFQEGPQRVDELDTSSALAKEIGQPIPSGSNSSVDVTTPGDARASVHACTSREPVASTSGCSSEEIAGLIAAQSAAKKTKASLEVSEEFQIPQNVLEGLSKSSEDEGPEVASHTPSDLSPVELIAAKSAAIENQIDTEMSDAFDATDTTPVGLTVFRKEAESEEISILSVSDDDFISSDETLEEESPSALHNKRSFSGQPRSEAVTIEVMDSGQAESSENCESGQEWGEMFDHITEHLTSDNNTSEEALSGRNKIPRLK